jgi:NTE family protein
VPMPELPMVSPAVKKAIAAIERTACVVTIQADEASLAAMGPNPLDPASAGPAAKAGRDQAANHLAEVVALWDGDGS